MIGTVPNVYEQTITTNGNYKENGVFTGVDVTVDVPNVAPVCDRVKVNTTTVMLTSFSTGTGASVTIPVGYCLVWIGPLNYGYRNV